MTKNRMSRKEAALFLGVSEKTLANWASSKARIIPYYRLGKKVFYDVEILNRVLRMSIKNPFPEEDAAIETDRR